MAITVALFTTNFNLAGGTIFAFNPDDISFGDADTRDITINRNGDIQVIQLKKESVTFSIKGVSELDLGALELARTTQLEGLIAGTGSPPGDIIFPGKTIITPIIYRVAPSGPIKVQNITIYETVEVEMRSPKYS